MHRRKPRRALALFAALVTSAALALFVNPVADAAITAPFTQTFSANTTGDIVLRGNSNLTCTPGASCTTALNATGVGNLDNNDHTMTMRDVDADGSTFNSSSSTVTLPAGSTVLFAGLYWGADTSVGAGGAASPSYASRNLVKLATPTAGYTTVTAAELPTAGNAYQGYADVTSQVAAGGNGAYTVANIQSATGADRYAGWALVIAYRDRNQPVRNLTVYDGFGVISAGGDTSAVINVGGFQTPPTGPVNTKLGTVVYEGDLENTGDSLKIDATTVSDAANPAANFFNSTVSDGGARTGAKDPDHANLLGLDIDRVSTTALTNNQTATSLTVATGGETFYPGVITFATELYAPNLYATMTGTDTDGATLIPGDEIEYSIDVANQGNDGAIDAILTDAVPSHTTYVPGSLTIDGSPASDAVGDDPAEIDAGTVRFRLGTGATGAAGGALAVGASTTVTFRVEVGWGTPGGTTVLNVANLSDKGANSVPPLELTAASDVSALTVAAASTDLQVTGGVTPGTVLRDGVADPVGYDLSVVNAGSDAEHAAVLTVTLPAGVVPSAATPSAGSCPINAQVVTCALGTIGVGGTVTVHVDADADNSAADPATAVASVTGDGTDGTPADNSVNVGLAVNDAPVASNDTANTTHHLAVTKNVLGNDSDPDGDALHVSGTATPAHGDAVVNVDNTITYTPDLGYKGTDTFAYTVEDARGGTHTGTLSVTVANAAPIAVADADSVAANTPATVSVLPNDTDPNGDGFSLTGVGQPAGGAGLVTDNGDGTVTFTPVASFGGDATFSYTVADSDGATATGSVTVTVANQAPVAAADTDVTAYLTDRLIDVRANDTDPNGDPLTVTAVGTPVDGGAVTRGTVGINGGTTVTYHPPAGFSGVVTFTYTISDGRTGTAQGTVTVTVGNGLPVAAGDSAGTAYLVPADVNVLAGDGDPEGGALTVTGLGTPGHGQVQDLGGGLVRYTPDAGFSGVDTFTYTVDDPNGGQATATVTVTVGNAQPVAADDTRIAEPDNQLVVPVLGNDTDPNPADVLTVTGFDPASAEGGTVTLDGDELVYQPADDFEGDDTFGYTIGDGHGGSASATVHVSVVNSAPAAADDAGSTPTDTAADIDVLANDTDPGGDALTVTGTTDGGYGTVTVGGSQTVTYTPDPGFTGIDTFTYQAGDGRGGFASALVTVTVLNAAPVAVPDALRAEPGQATDVDVLHNDTDANDHTLGVTGVGPAAHGTVTVAPGGTHVVYTSAPGYAGPDTFTYTASDGNGGFHTGTVTMTVNAAPVAVDDGPQHTATDDDVTIAVLGNDDDAEGDTLTVTVGPTSPHGTVVVNGDDTVTYTPAPGYAGTDSFPYTVTDPAGGISTATVQVVVDNAVPVAADDADSTTPGAPLDLSVLLNDTDANGAQQLTVTGVTQGGHGDVEITDPGTVRYTPHAYQGPDTFTYTVSDGAGGEDTATVTITVTNTGPQAADDTAQTTHAAGVDVDVLGNDTDPNDDPLTITAVTQPRDADDADRGTAVIDDGKIVFAPPQGFAGQVTFGYTVTDDDDVPATALVTVDVANARPDLVDDAGTTPYHQAVGIQVLINDTDVNHGDALTLTSVGLPKDAGGKVRGSTVITHNGTRVKYSPPEDFSGKVTFKYAATDGHGGSGTATVTVDVAPAPVTPDKTEKAGPGDPVTVTVPLADAQGRPLTVVDHSEPKHGTVQLNPDGTFTYVADKGFGGSDSFTYTVKDADGNLATGTITVTVANKRPVAKFNLASTGAGAAVVVKVLTGDTDADGDQLSITKVSRPAHGTVTINDDGTVTYTPEDGFTGTDRFTYTVSDGHGGTDSAAVTITVGGGGSGGGGTLPTTGVDVITLAGAGLAVLLAGAGLLVLGARRPPLSRHRRPGLF
jgi:uncharacterized repeat protein (TIGR01451 family)